MSSIDTLRSLRRLGFALAWLCLFGAACAPPTSRAESDLIDGPGLARILRENAGRPLVLNYWATWCRSCLPELKTLARIQKTYGPGGLRVLCVAVDPAEDPMRAALVRYMYAEAGELFGAFRVREGQTQDIMTVADSEWLEIVPVTYLIDARGRVVERLVGARATAGIESKLALILDGGVASPAESVQ